jgi:hypothetical protein
LQTGRAIRCVLAERFCYEVHIAGKLVIADECRSKSAPESETFVEDDRYEALVCVCPTVLPNRNGDKAYSFFALRSRSELVEECFIIFASRSSGSSVSSP